jgi:thiamine-phosphate pyrophosphorylase
MKLDLTLYCITDQPSSRGRSDDEVARALITGGASVLQYRAKKATAREQLATAIKLRALTHARKVPLIVNDRVDLAVACGADGVHLGQDDLPISAARLMVGEDLVVGVSTHSLEQALRAEHDGADYIGFGPIYPTQTKENNVAPVGIEALAQVLAKVKIPVVAIGGIKAQHLGALASAGAHNLAVVTAFTSADDVAGVVKQFKHQWLEARHEVDHARERADRDRKVQSSKKVSFL